MRENREHFGEFDACADPPKLSSDLSSALPGRHRLSGYEHLPPVSVPFRHFLSRLTCWAPAQRRSLGAKNSRKLPAHRCFAVSAEQIWAEARRRLQGILLYFQGLERSISPNLPAKTGRGSNPLSLPTWHTALLPCCIDRTLYPGSLSAEIPCLAAFFAFLPAFCAIYPFPPLRRVGKFTVDSSLFACQFPGFMVSYCQQTKYM